MIRRIEIASNKVTEYEWDYCNRLAGVFDKNAAGDVTQEVGFKYDAMNRIGWNINPYIYWDSLPKPTPKPGFFPPI